MCVRRGNLKRNLIGTVKDRDRKRRAPKTSPDWGRRVTQPSYPVQKETISRTPLESRLFFFDLSVSLLVVSFEVPRKVDHF